jgi:cytoskeletal protein CcmA (bactofilin family)
VVLVKRKIDLAVTLIATGTEISGDLRFSHQLYLNGHVTGDIVAVDGDDATVVISESGRVTGDIRARNVIVGGQVQGNVFAGGRVELASSARVRGDVHYRLMEMQLGATVDGRMLHHEIEAASADSLVAKPGVTLVGPAGMGPGPDT